VAAFEPSEVAANVVDALRTEAADVQAMTIRRSDQIEFTMFASLPPD
jgi:hypothetical protein